MTVVAHKPIPETTGDQGLRLIEPALLEHLPALHRPESSGLEPVKHNASRTVYRGVLGNLDVFLKHFHPQQFLRRVVRRLGLSDAMKECRLGQHLAETGVPTPRVLAACCRGGVEWIATETVTPVEDAINWHARQLARGPEGRACIERALVQLAWLIARMHDAGVVHHDLHSGNILVSEADNGDTKLLLTDLHRASLRLGLSRRARVANLAQLYHCRLQTTTATQRLRFLRAYLAASGIEDPPRAWQYDIERRGQRMRRKHFAKRDRRLTRSGKYFARLDLGKGWRAKVVLASKIQPTFSRAAQLELTRQDWRDALADVNALLDDPHARTIKNSPSGQVLRRVLRVGGHELDVYIKKPRRKQRWKMLVDCLRPSRPMRAFALGHALLTRGLATAVPLAALERRRGPRCCWRVS
jgi:tRNA A-37 threonylcarbamoyl transferase component Bud32